MEKNITLLEVFQCLTRVSDNVNLDSVEPAATQMLLLENKRQVVKLYYRRTIPLVKGVTDSQVHIERMVSAASALHQQIKIFVAVVWHQNRKKKR